jgi:predicted esterase
VREQRVLTAGRELAEARFGAILVHGRGGSAEGMLELAGALASEGAAWIAPQADGGQWYPNSFLAPIESNEPWLSASLALVGRLMARCGDAGLPPERIALVGFSQGACLASEFAARNARRYGGLVVLSGGLIGPPGTPRDYAGSLDGTPVLLGCSDVDPHIPVARVQETARVLGAMGGEVDERIYPGMGHTVVDDEIAAARRILDDIRAVPGASAGP